MPIVANVAYMATGSRSGMNKEISLSELYRSSHGYDPFPIPKATIEATADRMYGKHVESFKRIGISRADYVAMATSMKRDELIREFPELLKFGSEL